MDFVKLEGDLRDLRSRTRGMALTIGVLSVCLLIALVVVLNILGSERTVVVPPSINKTFWVTNDKASAGYLEQMGGFIAWLILDVSPESIDWKKDVLLTYILPDQNGAMKIRQDLEAARLKRISATTYFLPQQLVTNEAQQSVVIRGRLRTQVNGHDTTTESKAYLAEFSYAGGRTHLKTFKEIPNDQTPAQAAALDSGASSN